ncbi:MAG TPA: tetratricopeptide repeat protein [bacterium]|nr:tetratricopeptide repeat protein [bacterium]
MRHFLLISALLLFPPALWAQASETAIVKQAVQMEQETPTDTRIADLYDQLKAWPKDPQVHLKLGDVYYERALYELAILSYRQALAFQPKLALAHVGLSKVFRKQKQHAWEIAEMAAAVEDEPENAELRLRLGTLYMEPQHFEYDKAKKQFQALKKMNSPLALELGAKMGLD